MAGDWIKVEASTPDKREVLAITSAMGWDDPDYTVGKLIRVWRWFDQHSVGGNAAGVTEALLDRISGVTGFAKAMVSVGWLAFLDTGAVLPNFSRHCGETAKSRANTARRVARHRSKSLIDNDKPDGNDESNGQSVTPALAREEKRREEEERESPDPVDLPVDRSIDPPADTFAEFWAAYPRREAKAAAVKAWKRLKPDAELVATIVVAVKARCQTPQWLEAGGKFIPLPATYLNGERWLDNAAPKGPSRPSWWLAEGFGSEADAVRARNQAMPAGEFSVRISEAGHD